MLRVATIAAADGNAARQWPILVALCVGAFVHALVYSRLEIQGRKPFRYAMGVVLSPFTFGVVVLASWIIFDAVLETS